MEIYNKNPKYAKKKIRKMTQKNKHNKKIKKIGLKGKSGQNVEFKDVFNYKNDVDVHNCAHGRCAHFEYTNNFKTNQEPAMSACLELLWFSPRTLQASWSLHRCNEIYFNFEAVIKFLKARVMSFVLSKFISVYWSFIVMSFFS